MTHPPKPPLGELLETARVQAKLSIREAARRSGISDNWWRAVVSGSQNGGPAKGSSETIASMARTVGVTPEQLEAEGGDAEAADELRDLARREKRLTVVPDGPASADAGTPFEKALRMVLEAPDTDHPMLRDILGLVHQPIEERIALMEVWIHRDDPETGRRRNAGPAS